VYLAVFVLVTNLFQASGESYSAPQVLIRATGSLGFILLSIILCIGPLARISKRFIPFLYNRRHLGVYTCVIAVVHAALVIFWYHGFGVINPFVSVLVSNSGDALVAGLPFEVLGLMALIILILMAATSHDFWNSNLGPGLWKTIHMLVYLAYVLLVAHIMFGALQFEHNPVYVILMIGSGASVALLHMVSALRGRFSAVSATNDGWIPVAQISEFEEDRAKIVCPEKGESIAIFRHDNKISAVSNVCRHQGGPLGEGRVIDGCITCPWHGFQYRLEDGKSPEPFTEKVATFETKVESGTVYVQAKGNAPGTPRVATNIEEYLNEK